MRSAAPGRPARPGHVWAPGFVSGGATPIEGSMTADVFKFRDARNLFVGQLTVGRDEMTGQGTVGQNRMVAFTLRRVERAATPPR